MAVVHLSQLLNRPQVRLGLLPSEYSPVLSLQKSGWALCEPVGVGSIGRMPGTTAENGDVYQVYRTVTTEPHTLGNVRRPMACVAVRRWDPEAWQAMARSSTDGRPEDGDLFSPEQEDPRLDKAGYWSTRWLHFVLKTKTGTPACACLGHLTEPEKTNVLALYRNRHK